MVGTGERAGLDLPGGLLLTSDTGSDRLPPDELSVQLRRCYCAGQLEQGQWVAGGLGDDPVTDSLVEAAGR